MATITDAGRYDVTVQTVEVGQSSGEKKTPQVYMFFVTEPNEDGKTDGIGGWFYLSPRALPYTLKMLREVFSFNDDFETIVAQVKDKECSIVVALEPDQNGTEKPRVQFVNRRGGGAGAGGKIEGDATSFLKNLTASAKRIPQDKSRPAPSKPSPNPF